MASTIAPASTEPDGRADDAVLAVELDHGRALEDAHAAGEGDPAQAAGEQRGLHGRGAGLVGGAEVDGRAGALAAPAPADRISNGRSPARSAAAAAPSQEPSCAGEVAVQSQPPRR